MPHSYAPQFRVIVVDQVRAGRRAAEVAAREPRAASGAGCAARYQGGFDCWRRAARRGPHFLGARRPCPRNPPLRRRRRRRTQRHEGESSVARWCKKFRTAIRRRRGSAATGEPAERSTSAVRNDVVTAQCPGDQAAGHARRLRSTRAMPSACGGHRRSWRRERRSSSPVARQESGGQTSNGRRRRPRWEGGNRGRRCGGYGGDCPARCSGRAVERSWVAVWSPPSSSSSLRRRQVRSALAPSGSPTFRARRSGGPTRSWP